MSCDAPSSKLSRQGCRCLRHTCARQKAAARLPSLPVFHPAPQTRLPPQPSNHNPFGKAHPLEHLSSTTQTRPNSPQARKIPRATQPPRSRTTIDFRLFRGASSRLATTPPRDRTTTLATRQEQAFFVPLYLFAAQQTNRSTWLSCRFVSFCLFSFRLFDHRYLDTSIPRFLICPNASPWAYASRRPSRSIAVLRLTRESAVTTRICASFHDLLRLFSHWPETTPFRALPSTSIITPIPTATMDEDSVNFGSPANGTPASNPPAAAPPADEPSTSAPEGTNLREGGLFDPNTKNGASFTIRPLSRANC